MIGEESHLTDAPKMEGSLIIYEAESIEEVRKIVETDVYYTGNVVSMVLPSCIKLY